MGKMKPRFQAFLMSCLMCLFALNVTGQKLTGNAVFVESKKDAKVEITQQTNSSSSTFVPTNQPATDAQMQQVQISGNNQQPAAAVSGVSSTKVSYDFPSIPASEAQINQVKAVDSEEHVTAPPNNNLAKSAVCSSAVDYSDVNICSTDLPIGVGINSCDFIPETVNPDGSLIFSGVEIYPVANGAVSPFVALTTFQSQTLNSTVCTAPAFTLPPNTTCDVIEYDFVAFTYIYTGIPIDGGVEITSKTLDEECENTGNLDNAMDEFTIFVYPILELSVVETEPTTVDECGGFQAVLGIDEDTPCTEVVFTPCTLNGEILSFEFDYPFDGIGCPTTQFMSATTACSGCPCAANVDYADTEACTSADMVTVAIVDCTIDAPVANPDGTTLVPALQITATGSDEVIDIIMACVEFEMTFPANVTCDPVVYTYEVTSIVQEVDTEGNVTDVIVDECVETFTVTIYPEFTAAIVEDLTDTACGSLTIGLFNGLDELCVTSDPSMCPMTEGNDNGGMVTAELANPYADQGCSDASFMITSGPCLGCDCSGIVAYSDPLPICSEGVDDIPVTVSIADAGGDGNPDCDVTPEIDNGDGTLTVVGFDIYGPAGEYLATLFESATYGQSACEDIEDIGDIENVINVPANQTCEAVTYDFQVRTSVYTIASDAADIYAAVEGIVPGTDDVLCTPSMFSVTVNPTLSIQVTDSADGSCGSLTAVLMAEDGTVCTSTEVSAAEVCENNDDILTTMLTDQFGCVEGDLTITATCSGCFVPTVTSDGCDCFPDGIDNDGDGINELALIEITITDDETGVDWTLDSSGGLVNPDGSTPLTAMVIDNGDNTYTLTAYVNADNSTSTAIFTNTTGDGDLSFNSQPCPPCPPPLDEVPTVGEWGLIMLGLLMMITAIVGIRARREEEIYA